MIVPEHVEKHAGRVITHLVTRKATIATAESCTGGLIAGALTSVPGSSDAVYGGFVTYANEAKSRMIGVDPDLIARHGAVSEQVARAMAVGARNAAGTTFAVAVTGVAGPGGGSADKPVGLVHLAVAGPRGVMHCVERFGDIGRDAIREATVLRALEMLDEVATAQAFPADS